MSDTFVTVIAIILAVVLVIVIPLAVTSQRVDDVSQLDIETLTSNFVDEIRTTGKLTSDDYSKFLESLTATGNTYDVNLEFKILDENPGKKSMQTTRDKIGENVYYSIYTTQIEEVLNDKNEKNTYNLKQGDMVSVTVRNTNLTLGQQLKNFVYKIVGDDTYTISASKSGLVVGNGSTEIILSDNDANEDKITYILRENDANGKKLAVNDWTNQNVYVELSKESTYNLDLFYYWRYDKDSEDYINGYTKLDGNNVTITERATIQAYWKSSALEKYSNIEKIKINIDRIKPTIGNVTGSTIKGNTGTITVNGVSDTGGSGIYGYYYVWTDKNETPEAPTKDSQNWIKNSASIFTITANPDNNDKKCTVWVKDRAGNISDGKSAIVENIVPKITKVNLKDAIIKKGESIKIEGSVEGGNEYNSISYTTSNTSIATINSEGLALGIEAGKTTITCTITNYDGTTVQGTCTLTVIGVSFAPNGGNYIIPYTNETPGKATIKSKVTIIGAETAQYAWMTSKDLNNPPTNWTEFNTVTGEEVIKNTSESGNNYLWIKAMDSSGNAVIYVSNSFTVVSGMIKLTPSTTAWTNQNVTVTVTWPNTITQNRTLTCTGTNGTDYNINETSNATVITNNKTVIARGYDENGVNQSTATLTISNIDKVKPNAIISLDRASGTSTSNVDVKATVTLQDTLSGINTSSCKWVYTTSSGAIGTNPNSYTGGTFSSNTQTITLNNTSSGTYYLHVLTQDKAGNRNETISSAISIHIHTASCYSTTCKGTGKATTTSEVYYTCSHTHSSPGRLRSGTNLANDATYWNSGGCYTTPNNTSCSHSVGFLRESGVVSYKCDICGKMGTYYDTVYGYYCSITNSNVDTGHVIHWLGTCACNAWDEYRGQTSGTASHTVTYYSKSCGKNSGTRSYSRAVVTTSCSTCGASVVYKYAASSGTCSICGGTHNVFSTGTTRLVHRAVSPYLVCGY